jgi:hydrogenase expression/formation protein HypE
MSNRRDAEEFLPEGKIDPGRLEHLLELFRVADPALLVGPAVGEDAAAIRVEPGVAVLTTDPITFVSEASAAWLVQVNANDVAAMGARPRYLTVTGLFPPGTTAAGLESVFRDLADACRMLGVVVAGGHTEITRAVTRPVLVGQMMGLAPRDRIKRSGDARPGDVILLAGTAGREGSAILARQQRTGVIDALGEDFARAVAAWADPPGLSVVEPALALAAMDGVHALHDATEGGVATAVREVALASGTGCVLRAKDIPVAPETRVLCQRFGLDWLGLISSGLLVATAAPEAAERCLAALERLDVPAAAAGEILAEGFWLEDDAGRRELPAFPVDELTRAL